MTDKNKSGNVAFVMFVTVAVILFFAWATQAATLSIRQDAQPNNPQDFQFTLSGITSEPFFLDDDKDKKLSNVKTFTLKAGLYTVIQGAIDNWSLVATTCTGTKLENMSANLAFRQVTVHLEENDKVQCVFINTFFIIPPSLKH